MLAENRITEQASQAHQPAVRKQAAPPTSQRPSTSTSASQTPPGASFGNITKNDDGLCKLWCLAKHVPDPAEKHCCPRSSTLRQSLLRQTATPTLRQPRLRQASQAHQPAVRKQAAPPTSQRPSTSTSASQTPPGASFGNITKNDDGLCKLWCLAKHVPDPAEKHCCPRSSTLRQSLLRQTATPTLRQPRLRQTFFTKCSRLPRTPSRQTEETTISTSGAKAPAPFCPCSLFPPHPPEPFPSPTTQALPE